MTTEVWLPLSVGERNILREALAAYAVDGNAEQAVALSNKIAHTPSYPDITIGVHGGLVQWILGNPFPVRVCDYDGDDQNDLPHLDERGQRCQMGFVDPDPETMKTGAQHLQNVETSP